MSALPKTCSRSTSFERWHVVSRDRYYSMFHKHIVRVVACGIPRQVLRRDHDKPRNKVLNSSAGTALTRDTNRSAPSCHIRHEVSHSLRSTGSTPHAQLFCFRYALCQSVPRSAAARTTASGLTGTNKHAHMNEFRAHKKLAQARTRTQARRHKKTTNAHAKNKKKHDHTRKTKLQITQRLRTKK